MEAVSTQHIANAIKKLRKERALSQGELSKALKISQAQLSLIENAKGSLNAEQLLALCLTYNLGLNDFLPPKNKQTPEDELQNALAIFGAKHLIEIRGVVISPKFQDVHEVFIETLVAVPSSSCFIGLAPVILTSFDTIHFTTIYKRVSELGFAQRLLWLLCNTCLALKQYIDVILSERDKRIVFRKAVTLETEYEVLKTVFLQSGKNLIEDILIPRVTSARGLDDLRERRDAVAKEWGVLTDIGVDDFFHALKQASDLKLKVEE